MANNADLPLSLSATPQDIAATFHIPFVLTACCRLHRSRMWTLASVSWTPEEWMYKGSQQKVRMPNNTQWMAWEMCWLNQERDGRGLFVVWILKLQYFIYSDVVRKESFSFSKHTQSWWEWIHPDSCGAHDMVLLLSLSLQMSCVAIEYLPN